MNADGMETPAVVMFARCPELGRVKTRLARGIGAERALAVYRWMGRRQLMAFPVEWNRIVYYDPPGKRAEARMREWLGEGVRLVAQCEGDLGARLSRASREVFASGASAAIFVGTDCPELGEEVLRTAWLELGSGVDAVFGPSRDGGYYLLALRRHCPELFAGIRWSAAETLADSLEAARRAGLQVRLLWELEDVDTEEALLRAIDRGVVPAAFREGAVGGSGSSPGLEKSGTPGRLGDRGE